jgi:catechol 2,3-dioxygenase-like lactoylglutathione lyase family enzyme
MAIQLSGIQHVGVPVSNLERSMEFYEKVFGVKAEIVAAADHPRVAAAVGIENAVLKVAFLWVGNTYLELLEYTNPIGRPNDRRNCDIGAVHVAFEVDDVWAAWEELRANGVDLGPDPWVLEGGELEGCTFAYFKDPDGIQLEFFNVPPEKRRH